jgi:aminopeptidase N
VREAELDPKDYVELAIKNIAVEQDESTIQAILSRVGTAMNYYLPDTQRNAPSARLEAVLTERIGNAKTPGQRITFYRAYLNLASSAQAQKNLKDILAGKSKLAVFQLRTKDKFDLVTRLLILGDKTAPQLLANLEKTETSDDAKRYAYAARAGIATQENKAKYFKDFMTNKEISESWIEAAFVPFNSSRHADLTLPYLETALAELPNLKKTRKIFFVNGWLGAFIGGQKSEEALAIVNKFLAENQNLDKDLRLKILENVDGLERAVKIRGKFGK